MKSHSFYTFLFKHLFLLIAFVTGLVGIFGYLFPDSVTINGEASNFDLYDYIIIGAIATLAVICQIFFGPNFVKVKLGGQNITILDYEPEEVVNWMNVESISKFTFIAPPLYKLKIKGEEGYYLFTTQPTYAKNGFGTSDLSFMGSFIKRKKKEFNI